MRGVVTQDWGRERGEVPEEEEYEEIWMGNWRERRLPWETMWSACDVEREWVGIEAMEGLESVCVVGEGVFVFGRRGRG